LRRRLHGPMVVGVLDRTGMSGRVRPAAQTPAQPGAGKDAEPGEQGGERRDASNIGPAGMPGVTDVVGGRSSRLGARSDRCRHRECGAGRVPILGVSRSRGMRDGRCRRRDRSWLRLRLGTGRRAWSSAARERWLAAWCRARSGPAGPSRGGRRRSGLRGRCWRRAGSGRARCWRRAGSERGRCWARARRRAHRPSGDGHGEADHRSGDEESGNDHSPHKCDAASARGRRSGTSEPRSRNPGLHGDRWPALSFPNRLKQAKGNNAL
jgi:hypothetical protein